MQNDTGNRENRTFQCLVRRETPIKFSQRTMHCAHRWAIIGNSWEATPSTTKTFPTYLSNKIACKGYSRRPEVGYLLDEFIPLLKMWFSLLVVLLFHFQNFFRGFFVESIDVVLARVDFFQSSLRLGVVISLRCSLCLFQLLLLRRGCCVARHDAKTFTKYKEAPSPIQTFRLLPSLQCACALFCFCLVTRFVLRYNSSAASFRPPKNKIRFSEGNHMYHTPQTFSVKERCKNHYNNKYWDFACCFSVFCCFARGTHVWHLHTTHSKHIKALHYSPQDFENCKCVEDDWTEPLTEKPSILWCTGVYRCGMTPSEQNRKLVWFSLLTVLPWGHFPEVWIVSIEKSQGLVWFCIPIWWKRASMLKGFFLKENVILILFPIWCHWTFLPPPVNKQTHDQNSLFKCQFYCVITCVLENSGHRNCSASFFCSLRFSLISRWYINFEQSI